MTATLQAYVVTLTDPQVGHRGGKRQPIISRYVVTATSNDEALALFRDECPSLIADTTKITVSGCGCRVMGAR